MNFIQRYFHRRELKQCVITKDGGISFIQLEKYLEASPNAKGKPLVIKKGLDGKPRISHQKQSAPARLMQYVFGKEALAVGRARFLDKMHASGTALERVDSSPGVAYAIAGGEGGASKTALDTDELHLSVKMLAAAERSLLTRVEMTASVVDAMRRYRHDLLPGGRDVRAKFPDWKGDQQRAKALNDVVQRQMNLNAGRHRKAEMVLRKFVSLASAEAHLTEIQFLEQLLMNSATPYGLADQTFEALLRYYEALRKPALDAAPIGQEPMVFPPPAAAQSVPPEASAKQVRFGETITEHEAHGVTKAHRASVRYPRPSPAPEVQDPPSVALKEFAREAARMTIAHGFTPLQIEMAKKVLGETRKLFDPEKPLAHQAAIQAAKFAAIRFDPEFDELAQEPGSSDLDYLVKVLGSTPMLLLLPDEDREALLKSLDEAFAGTRTAA